MDIADRRIRSALLAVSVLAGGLIGGVSSAVAQGANPGASAPQGQGGYTPTNAAGQIEVILKDHVFTPSQIRVPANKRMQLLIKNQDPTADEFDSTSLKVEKVIGGNSEGVVRLRELDPGTYPFMGEFNSSTAQGVVIAE